MRGVSAPNHTRTNSPMLSEKMLRDLMGAQSMEPYSDVAAIMEMMTQYQEAPPTDPMVEPYTMPGTPVVPGRATPEIEAATGQLPGPYEQGVSAEQLARMMGMTRGEFERFLRSY